jgi:pyruvate dehydrogenase (quinone)
MSGLLGYGACYDAMHDADPVIMLGTDFPYDTFLPGARTAQVDIDPARLGRRTPLELGVVGDVGATIRALLPKITPKPDRTFLDHMLHRHARAPENAVDVYTHDVSASRPMHPEYVAAQLDLIASQDAIFTVDTGMNNVWAARYLTPNGRRRVIGSFRHGSMANALPQAIGAQTAAPKRQVVAMSGDGGLSMLMGELSRCESRAFPSPWWYSTTDRSA